MLTDDQMNEFVRYGTALHRIGTVPSFSFPENYDMQTRVTMMYIMRGFATAARMAGDKKTADGVSLMASRLTGN